MYLTEEQTAFVDNIKKMVDRHVAPIAAEIDETDRFPEELVPIFGDMGLLQQWVPEQYGGPGGNLTLLCLAKHEIAKVSMACSILAGQNSIGMILPLLHFGTEEQKRQRFLPQVAKGRTLTSVCMSEPHCGSDVAAMKTKAVRDGSSYVINGEKCFITFGSVAHWVLLFARTSEGRGVNGISAFLVDTKTPGFKVGRNERKMGLGGVPNVQLFFEDMRVPVENRLGEEGQGFKACMHILDLNRPTVAAASIGLGQGALDAAIAYAKRAQRLRQADRELPGPAVDDRGHGDAARGRPRAAVRMHAAGRQGRFQPAFDDGLDGQMLRQRRRHEGDDRRGADFRRRRLSQGLSGRADDARRQDQPDLGGHQPDPAHRDLASSAGKRGINVQAQNISPTRSTESRTAQRSASAAGSSIRSRWRWCAN